MQQIIYFFSRYRTFFLFLFLLFLGFLLIVRINYYHQSLFLNSSNALFGGLYEVVSDFRAYLSLKKQNKVLALENSRLRNQLLSKSTLLNKEDSILIGKERYLVNLSRVVKNSISLSKNYLTIDIGEDQGVKQDMGVLSSKGIVGIIESSSSNYSMVQSILNMRSRLNVKLKNTGHFGSLVWNGKALNRVQVIDIPKIAPLTIGDTIVTGGMSSIFPKGIPVGTIKDFSINNYDNSYQIEVSLFTDMSNLEYVYVLDNKNKQEIKQLENSVDE